MSDTAFYCVSSDVYFLGAVGMLNSLRLAGHTEPVFVLDFGLRPEQRALLEPAVKLVDAPGGLTPHLAKTVAPIAHPADVMVLIDADMIVTRPLDEPIAQAAAGGVVAAKDNLDRFVAQWGELLGLGATRSGPYVSSGLVIFGGEEGRRALELLDRLQRSVALELDVPFNTKNPPPHPFRYLEQDVLNAILRTAVPDSSLTVIPQELVPVPPFHGIRLTSATPLRCRSRNGSEPYVLHQFVRKPWLERMYDSPYSKALSRCLVGDDLTVRVPRDWVPLHLRPGAVAAVARAGISAYDAARWTIADAIPDRLAALRRRGP